MHLLPCVTGCDCDSAATTARVAPSESTAPIPPPQPLQLPRMSRRPRPSDGIGLVQRRRRGDPFHCHRAIHFLIRNKSSGSRSTSALASLVATSNRSAASFHPLASIRIFPSDALTASLTVIPTSPWERIRHCNSVRVSVSACVSELTSK